MRFISRMTLRELLYEYGDRFKIFLNNINDFIEQFSMVLQCNTSILDIPLKNVFIMLFCILYFFYVFVGWIQCSTRSIQKRE